MKKIVATTEAPEAIGPYNQAIIDPKSGLIFTSGQIAIDPKTGELAGTDISSQTRQTLANLKAVLIAAGSGLENSVKVVVYLTDLNDFSEMNKIYAEYFGKDFPARATVQVSKLPKDALIEMEVVALSR